MEISTVKKPLTVSSSPHIRDSVSTRGIMLQVCIALAPALAGAVYFFGFRALALDLVSVGSCIFFEWLYRRIMKLDNTVGDCSAIVTGILIAFTCPVTAPYWMVVIGDAFAIVVVKQLFGGIGQNFMNPALAARAFMLISWPVYMTTWVASGTRTGLFSTADAVSSATPLATLHAGSVRGLNLLDLFLGKTGGCIGEVSALLLLLGGAFLVIRRIISLRIPLSFLLTVALLAFLFPKGGSAFADRLTWAAAQLLTGGVMLGAIFMATDYTTSPVTKWGQVLFGIGCGALTIFIRYFGSYPEGVSFAILLMNACVGIFDRVGRPRRFGEVRKEAAAK